MTIPHIFISATSGDLGSVRQAVKEALLTSQCHPVEQAHFGPDARTIPDMLLAQITDCQALIHIVGMRYGAEPDPATLPPGAPRHSYSQMEYHFGRRLQKKHGDDNFRVYTFICTENFPYDGEPDQESEEKQALQLAHRSQLCNASHLYGEPKNHQDIRNLIHSLIRKERDGVIINAHKWMMKKTAMAILGTLILASIIWFQRPPRPPVLDKELSIVVVMGEDVEYEQIIRDSFLAHLEQGLIPLGYKLKHKPYDPHFGGTDARPDSPNGKEKWANLVSEVKSDYEDLPIDFFITIGTYASQVVKKEPGLMKRNRLKGLIYLGVTDPVIAKLTGHHLVSGVQYGTGGKNYGKMLDDLFNTNQRLVFLYKDGVIQDQSFRKQLDILNQEYDGISTPSRLKPRFAFDMKGEKEPIKITDIEVPDPNHTSTSAIYFAWYTMDNILAAMGGLNEVTRDKLWVIPSTYSARNLKSAGAIVSVHDKLVGKEGAEIVLNVLLKEIEKKGLDLGQEPIRQVPFHTWLCRTTIINNHLDNAIKPEILINANMGKYDWITFGCPS